MVAATCISTAPLLAAENYSVQATWKLGGDGGWDYLTMDPDAHLLYITRGNRVMVVDVQTGKLAAEIPGFEGIHGVALDSAGKYGYVSDGRASMVRVFDRGTRQVVASIPVDQGPDSIVFEPVQKYVFSMNGQGKSTSVIDTATNKVIATIPLPGRPEATAADGKGNSLRQYRRQERARPHRCRHIKGHRNLVARSLRRAFGLRHRSRQSPRLLRLRRQDDGRHRYRHRQSRRHSRDRPRPRRRRLRPQRGLVYSSNGQDGTLTILHQDSPDSYSVVQTVPTKRGARTMALDPSTGKVYLVTADFGPRPAPTADNPRPRPPILPGTFTVLVVGK